MKFLKLRAANFLTIGDSGDLALDGRGLVLIQGINQDDPSATSNGAGKSSIPDALFWCLYGETARGESGDAVVNFLAKKDCYVKCVLQDGESVYEITRHRKHKTFKNQTTVRVWNPASSYPDAVPADIAKGTEKETQELITEIMGCSVDVFKAAIYAGQEDMPDLPRMADKQLKMLIEQASGVERLEQAYTLSRARELKKNEELAGCDRTIERLNAQLASVKAQQFTMQSSAAEFEGARPIKQKEYLDTAARIGVDLKEAHAKFTSLNEPAVKTELAELNAKLAEHQKLLDHASAQSSEIIKVGRVMAGKETEHKQALQRVQRGIDALSNAETEILSKPCGECGKPHTIEELDSYKAHLNASLEREKSAEIGIRQAFQDAINVYNAAVKAHADFTATLPSVSDLSARANELNAILRQAVDLRNLLLRTKTTYDQHQAAAVACLSETNPHASGVAAFDLQISQVEEELVKLKAGKEKLQTELEIAQGVTKVFGPAGVRAHILDTVTPFLNERTSDYLNALSEGNISAMWSTLAETTKGELREKFNIDVENDKGAKSFAGLSGGEKRKVRLATMWALQDLVTSRAVKPIDLWIGDEVDDALDPAGLERLMGILERKARERGTVLVVSHAELTDWIDQIVTVTKVGGKSIVEGALSL